MNKIKSEVVNLHTPGRIPQAVTNVGEAQDEYGSHLISFTKYHHKDKKCELCEYKASQIVEKLTILQKCDHVKIRSFLSPVHNSGNYSFLFNGLSPDIDLFEMTCGRAGRIFLFLVKNIVCVRLVKKNHINTKGS